MLSLFCVFLAVCHYLCMKFETQINLISSWALREFPGHRRFCQFGLFHMVSKCEGCLSGVCHISNQFELPRKWLESCILPAFFSLVGGSVHERAKQFDVCVKRDYQIAMLTCPPWNERPLRIVGSKEARAGICLHHFTSGLGLFSCVGTRENFLECWTRQITEHWASVRGSKAAERAHNDPTQQGSRGSWTSKMRRIRLGWKGKDVL